MVENQLHEQRARDGKHLEDRAEQEQARQRPTHAGYPSDELPERHLAPLGARMKLLVRQQLQGHAREVRGELLQTDRSASETRVQDDGGLPLDLDEHDEVVQVPMQDGGKPEAAQRFELQPQRTGAQVQRRGDLDQAGQSGALERHRVAAAQRGQIGPMTVVACHHGETRQAAFGCFGLQNDRRSPPAGEGEPVTHV